MSHLDPEILALLALGEQAGTIEDRAHLAACPDCATEMVAMRHTVAVARSAVDETELEVPSPRVWSSIVSDLNLGADAAIDPFGASLHANTTTSGEQPAPVLPSDAPIRRRDRGRGRTRGRALWTLAASLVVVAAIGTGVWISVARNAPAAIAAAVLDAFPTHAEAVGTAEVEQSRNGGRTLTVTLEGDVQSEDYREVWLIRNDGGALISLGVLDGDSGAFSIPAGVDLTEYDLVDISFEPIDGDPAHSGDSIVRGQLRFEPGVV